MSNNQEQGYAKLMEMASKKIAKLEAELEAVKGRDKAEPIAIVGIGCRFPGGASTPKKFWELLENGVDAITEVPKDRWNVDDLYDPDPTTPGKICTRYGGFIDGVQEFDADFFSLTPKETISLDPQQRILLEVTWEAIENYGKNPEELKGSKAGVFIGICSNEYMQRVVSQGKEKIDAYMGTGNINSAAAGRISYTLDLVGPCFAVNTACSSSLVAIHLACASLRNKECNLALAGGVNQLVSPELSINFSKAQMLSPDGRSKTFDASANGFVRGEGCGMIVLKRLSEAVADDDNILAVIRGTAINQDGYSSGLTVPKGPSQQAVIRQALENGGVDPGNVSYIEAHGTGTSLGDPIEIGAIGTVFEKTHSQERPLIVGAVKTNIGHLEGAAGVAGLIKVVLQLQHQKIAPLLHLKKLNPYINWSELPVKVPIQIMPWQTNGTRIAGVSSFGFSGTNAHVVLEEAPLLERQKSKGKSSEDITERSFHLLTLSGKKSTALRELVLRYQKYLAERSNAEKEELDNICYTANAGRAHFNHRLAVIASNERELAAKLGEYQKGQEVAGISSGEFSGEAAPKIAFLFTGQGAQYVNMGRQLYETQPLFKKTVDQCAEKLSSYMDRPILEVLYGSETDESVLEQTAYTQPALFVIEYALCKLWQSWGIEPDAVMGHSVGEYVAATVAGIWSLDDGLKLIATRGRLMQQLPPGGVMVAVMASESQVREAIAFCSKHFSASVSASVGSKHFSVSIAAINGPQSVVISGEAEKVKYLLQTLEAGGIQTKQLQVSHAFHSPLMEPMLAEFEAVAKQITYSQGRIPIISNVTGGKADNSIATSKYWVNHVRQPVRFSQSMEALRQMDLFLEIGPKPILLGMGRRCLPEGVGVWLPSLRPGMDEWQQMLSSLGELYVRGVKVDWFGFDKDYLGRRKVSLPTYPFQRQRYWVDETRFDRPHLLEESNNESSEIEIEQIITQQEEYNNGCSETEIEEIIIQDEYDDNGCPETEIKQIITQQIEIMYQHLDLLHAE
ncbi:MAG: type I polyketide synthase [Moorea sp. SIO4A3]|nr:type I polyketide synthase [Moorena sp. SIO4A3]